MFNGFNLFFTLFAFLFYLHSSLLQVHSYCNSVKAILPYKVLNFLLIPSVHTFFYNLSSFFGLLVLGPSSSLTCCFLSFANFYPEDTEYWPFVVEFQTSLPVTPIELTGILNISCASPLLKIPLISSSFYPSPF